MKCIVKDCENHSHEGGFTGDLCNPCHRFITTGEGTSSQAYRNSNLLKELTDTEILQIHNWVWSEPNMDWENGDVLFARALLRKAQEK